MKSSAVLTIVGPKHDKELLAQVDYSASLAKALKRYLIIAYIFDDQLEHYGYVDPLATDKDKDTFIEYVKSNNRAFTSIVFKDLKEQLQKRLPLDYDIFNMPLSKEQDTLKALSDQYDIDLTIISKKRLKTMFFSKKMIVPSWICNLNSRLLLFEP